MVILAVVMENRGNKSRLRKGIHWVYFFCLSSFWGKGRTGLYIFWPTTGAMCDNTDSVATKRIIRRMGGTI